MSDKREVECQDCGYRWESSARNPRCSQSECGRSRNVEPVNASDDDRDSTNDGDDGDSEPDGTDEDTTPDNGPSSDSQSNGGFTASFEGENVEAEHEPDTKPTQTPEPEPTESDDDTNEGDDGEAEESGFSDDEIPEVDPEQLSVAFSTTFDMAATRRGDHWELEDKEADQLGTAWAPVANEYLPMLFREHTPFGVALIATVSIVGPRLAIDKKKAEQAEREAAEERDGEPGEVREPEVVENPNPSESSVEQPEPDATSGGFANV